MDYKQILHMVVAAVFFAIFFISFAAILIRMMRDAIVGIRTRGNLKKHGVRTIGFIQTIHKETVAEADIFKLKIKFSTDDGRSFLIECSRDYNMYQKDMAMPIVYNPNNPSICFVDDKTKKELFSEFLIYGIFFLVVMGLLSSIILKIIYIK
jgi:hypothetical protein